VSSSGFISTHRSRKHWSTSQKLLDSYGWESQTNTMVPCTYHSVNWNVWGQFIMRFFLWATPRPIFYFHNPNFTSSPHAVKRKNNRQYNGNKEGRNNFAFWTKTFFQDNLVQINFVLSAAIFTPSEKENSRKVETTTLVIMRMLQNSILPTFRPE
jgi:hypothetical protein